MKKRRFWVRALLGLLTIGLLIGASSGAFRMGWWQGYRAAQVTEDGNKESTRGWPMMGHGSWMSHRYPGGWMSPFGGGSLLRVGLLLGVLFLVAGLIRSCAWRAAGHVPHGMPRKHWHHPHCGHPWSHAHPPHAHPPHAHPSDGEHSPCGDHPPQGHGFEAKYSPDQEAAPETGNKDQE